jgi:hypothetical protein
MSIMRTRWIKVDARIVECFRAWEEPANASRPAFEIVADIKLPAGTTERVSCQQRLITRTHRWRPPDPGDVVPGKWDSERRQLRLELSGDIRYDERMIKRLGRTVDSPTWPPTGVGGM